MVEINSAYSKVLSIMHDKCFDKSWSEDEFNSILNNKFNKAVLAITRKGEDSHPLGFLLYHEIDKEAEILTICTLPKYRKKGVARSLLSGIKSKKTFIDVDVENFAAMGLYKNAGFIEGRVRQKYYENGNDAIMMIKESLAK